MNKLRAFIAHSFDEKHDGDVVKTFLDYFDSLKDIFGLEYDHAERAEAKAISQKVKDKMEGKNLFIGIFTTKNHRIERDNLKTNLPLINYGRKHLFAAESSNWIIQESGYALAKGMHLLFLFEKGIEVDAGLHADLEFVEFVRENPSECFTKINEILGSLSIESRDTMTIPISASAPETIKNDIDEEQISEEPSVRDEQGYKKFITAHDVLRSLIVKEKDISNAEKKLDEIIKEFKDDEMLTSSYWKSQFYRFKIKAGFPEALSELEKISVDNPDDIYSSSVLVNAYKQYGQYSKAAEKYLKKSKIETIKINDRIEHVGNAAECYALDKRFDIAYDIILEAFINDRLDRNSQYILYKKLYEIAKIQEKEKLVTAFAEKALEISPTDYSLRFSLAYLYSEKGYNANSLPHYKFLCEQNPDGSNWNNLGVEYKRLDIKGKSIESYQEAANEYGETLAMANMADRYIEEGFLREANDILKIAKSKDNYHENVDSATVRINEIKRNEDESLSNILKNTEPERIFRVRFAEAYILPLKDDITGKWSTSHGDITISMDGHKIYGETEENFKSTTNALLAMSQRAGGYGVGMLDKNDSKRKIIISGEINNRSIEFQLKIIIISPDATPLSSGVQEWIYNGLMCISEDARIINVMEWEKDKNKINLYEMRKL